MTKMCFIEATVPTGFEAMACEEVNERLGTSAVSEKGRISFSTEIKTLNEVRTKYRPHVV